MKNRLEELWARGLVFYGAVPPTRATIVSSKVYRDVMQRERRELYPPPAQVEMYIARDEAGLHWECLELGRKMRAEREKEIESSDKKHEGSDFAGALAA